MMAIILAAGRGSRLGRLTDEQPKCRTRLAGRTLLDWQLDAIRAAGIDDILVVGGYRADRLAGRGYAVLDNPRWAESNMVVSLVCAAPALARQPTIVCYGDGVYHPETLRRLAAASGDIVVAADGLWERLWRARFPNPLHDAESFCARAGRLVEIGARPAALDDVEAQYMGLLKFTPAGWQRVARHLETLSRRARDKLDMTALLRGLLAAGVIVRTVTVQGRWVEVDSENDVRVYEACLADAEAGAHAWSHDWRWPGCAALENGR